VKKEWFQLLTHDLFREEYGMFRLDKLSQNYWFSNQSDSLQDFKLVGMLMGLALYNSVILDVHFPLFLYKYIQACMVMKLNPGIKFKPKLCDLEDVDPEVYNGLKELLCYDGNVEEDFDLTFVTTTKRFGVIETHELKPGGSKIVVTSKNREEYVNLMLCWKLMDSIKPQLNAFMDGFLLVCDPKSPALSIVCYDELELLICGERILDWDELEKNTEYDNGYSADDPIIKAFWRYFRSMPEETKKQFLRFCTGSDRCPVGGLRNVGLVITRHGDTDKLPTSSTCFSRFFLPAYTDEEVMKKKVSQAIQFSTGFGLV